MHFLVRGKVDRVLRVVGLSCGLRLQTGRRSVSLNEITEGHGGTLSPRAGAVLVEALREVQMLDDDEIMILYIVS